MAGNDQYVTLWQAENHVILRHQSDAEVPRLESVFSMSTICLLDVDMVASSAYNIVLIRLMNSGISLISIKNNRGPKIDPCGIPELIVCGCDSELLTDTRCDRFLRYD